MEAYPIEYVEHNLPLIVLFGIEDQKQTATNAQETTLLQQGAFVVKSDLPPVHGDTAKRLVARLQSCNGESKAWHARAVSDPISYFGFRVKTTGRKYILPPRKADPPRESTGYSPPGSPSIASASTVVLHSPLSPLSPDAPTYPDGLMTPLWLKKHQEYIPSALISFFSFTNDANLNSLNDNQLKSDINQVHSGLRSSGYKTRHVVVLISDSSILHSSDVDDRIAGIKRATGLDSKNSLFLLPPTLSEEEISNFTGSVLTALQPYCIEYYRDLTKHARRKKSRGSVPPPTLAPTMATSHALSNLGWNIRYDFKLGVFAEFRQEMDAAGRHYNAVLDALLSADGIFETTASWSPRWDETRLLADCTALRFIRTLLWSSTTTQAVQTWVRYRDRMRELIDKRGKGSNNYGWEAWESRWAKVMAELVQRADLPVFQLPPAPAEPESLLSWILNVFAPPEKSIPVGERLPPWHLLHHSGYWQRLAGAHAKARRTLAMRLPDEDRTPPGQSPAALVASRHNTYDTYLCPEPHEELPSDGSAGFSHVDEISDKYMRSGKDFLDRNQQRLADQCDLEQARALMAVGSYSAALDVLGPLWKNMRWRREKWYEAAYEITRALNESAMQAKHAQWTVISNWELQSTVFRSSSEEIMKQHSSRTAAVFSDTTQTEVTLVEDSIISPLSTSVVFAAMEGHVADRLKCQVSLTFRAHLGSTPLSIASLHLELEGSVIGVEVVHDTSTGTSNAASSRLTRVDLTETQEEASQSSYKGCADLTLYPGSTLVLEMDIMFRSAGNIAVKETSVIIDTPQWKLTHVSSPHTVESINATWWNERSSGLKPKRIPRREDGVLKVLPKLPKLDISLLESRKAYFTDESANLQLRFVNEEEEDVDADVDVSVVDGSEDNLALVWASNAASSDADQAEDTDKRHARIALGKIGTGEERTESLHVSAPTVPSDCILQIRAIYYLATDMETPVSKAFRMQLNFVSPFEANYDFAPRVHPEIWPSYFSSSSHDEKQSADRADTKAFGLKQRWSLVSKIASFADEALVISNAELVVNTPHGGITASITPLGFEDLDLTISPQEIKDLSFTIDVQKLSIEDRRASALETALKLTWNRPSANSTDRTSTTLRVPRLLIPQLEPRVLASCTMSSSVGHLKHITYSIENPTIHFLTFDLTMEANEEFAIGGSKIGSINVLPMSREELNYRLLPLVRSKWVRVNLRVTDRYFNKTLRVLAGEGVREGKEGLEVRIE